MTCEPVWAARMGANGQYVVPAGLVAVAVGCERIVAAPDAPGSVTLSLLLFGGRLYVGTQTWLFAVTTHDRLTMRWTGRIALAVAGTAAILLPAVASLGLACAVLIPLAAYVIRGRMEVRRYDH